MTPPRALESNGSIPLVSLWPLLSGPPSGMGAYFRGLQGDGRYVRFKELIYRSRRGVAAPAVLRRLEHQFLAPIRNGRILDDIADRPWVLGGQQFVSHFSRRRLETATVVVFDLIDILCPESNLTSGQVRTTWKAMENVRSAQTVVTISEYSRERIIGLYDIDPDRVSVIPFGVDAVRFRPGSGDQKAACREAFGLPKSSLVVLYVGSEQRRKNLPTLIAGLAQYRKKDGDLVFVKAGESQSDLGRSRFSSALRANQMEQATMLLQELSEGQMADLYRAADILAFPSVEEGWGIPVLEAMASGVPVLSSRIPPVVEFAGDTVLYVDDPFSPGDWSSGLAELRTNDSLRATLSTAGRRRALDLTWDRARGRFAARTQLGAVSVGQT